MSFVFSQVWDASFEGQPPDTQNINLGAGRIRELKVDISQRMKIDHQWAGNAFDGKHMQIQLPPIAAPALDGGDGCVYAGSTGGITELFYKDSAGHLVQLTANGGVAVPSSFPAGTRLAFSNNAPPPGWIQLTGVNDRVIRMVDDSSGQSFGGGWGISGVTVSTSTITGTTTTTSTSTTTGTSTSTGVTLSGGIAVDGHTLTIAEIPPIALNSDYPTFTGTLNASGSNASSLITGTTVHGTSSVGGGGAHSHSVTNTLGASATSTSTSTSSSTSTSNSVSSSSSISAVNADGTWRPAYVNFCLGQKT